MTDASNTMRIWDAVSRTDPTHTKRVNQRGGFTAISAHYQIMQATKQFGPIGIGWGYIDGAPIFEDGLVIVPVTVWHGDRANTFGPLYGSAEMRPVSKAGPKLDSDAPKKASTDGLTKGLSQLGFNADVFLGKFDDNKYIAQMEREFAPPAEPAQQPQRARPVPLKGAIKTKAELRVACGEFVSELHACADGGDLALFLALPESVALMHQVEEETPNWWLGDGADFLGMAKEIEHRREMLAIDEHNPQPIFAAG